MPIRIGKYGKVVADDFMSEDEDLEMDSSRSKSRSGHGNNKVVPAEFRQFERVGVDHEETIKDSIHLDWTSVKEQCPECGVNVKIWDGFAHRMLWNRTWLNAAAWQPLGTRYETDRWDSPIEGFVFRLWEWHKPGDTFSRKADMRRLYRRATTFDLPTPGPVYTHQDAEEDPDEDEYSLENLIKRGNDQDFPEEDDDYYHRNQGSSSDWITNMIPFGHPNLGGNAGRRLMSISNSQGGKNRLPQHKRKAAELVRVLNVTESIFYATLNHTTPRMVRLFSHRIVQRCVLTPVTEDRDFFCTPHYHTQPNTSK